MKVKKGTIVRTAVLILALINQALTIAGKNPLPWTSDEAEQGFSMIITIGAALVSWWKNNSFTEDAIRADLYLDRLRGE